MSKSSFLSRISLSAALGKSHDGQRDTYQSFGYPLNLTNEHFLALYYRNDIANRIVRAFPSATWRDYPQVTDDSEEDDLSEFCLAFRDFFEKRNIFSYLERADRLSGIGQFGLLHLGFDDGRPQHDALEPGNHPLLYLRPYGQHNVTVTQWDMNPSSPRYGLPKIFTVMNNRASSGGNSSPSISVNIHYTRCIHIAEFLESDEFFGTPRLEAVFNRMKDLEKVVGAAAETFFQNSKKPISFETEPDANIADSADDKKALQNQMDEFYHQLRPYLALQGIKANVLETKVEDPSGIVDKILDLIAGTVGIPKRILIGSERGELSSAQDENNWSARIDERRQNFAAPMIVKPLIEMLIATQNLPQPIGNYRVKWESGGAIGEVEKAGIALQKSQALQVYGNTPSAPSIVSPEEMRVWLGLDPDELPEIEEDLPGLDITLQEDKGSNEQPAQPRQLVKD